MWLLHMNFLKLLYEILRLFDQRTFRHFGKLQLQLVMELFKLLNLILHALSLTQQCKQLILQLSIKLCLNVFDEVFNFFAFIFFTSCNFLDSYLNFTHVLG